MRDRIVWSSQGAMDRAWAMLTRKVVAAEARRTVAPFVEATAWKIDLLARMNPRAEGVRGVTNRFAAVSVDAKMGTVTSESNLKSLSRDIDSELEAQRTVWRYNRQIDALRKGSHATQYIESTLQLDTALGGANRHELNAAIQDLGTARGDIQRQEMTTGSWQLLDGRRQAVLKAEERLQAAYEKAVDGKPSAGYVEAQTRDLMAANRGLLNRAIAVPDIDPRVPGLQEALRDAWRIVEPGDAGPESTETSMKQPVQRQGDVSDSDDEPLPSNADALETANRRRFAVRTAIETANKLIEIGQQARSRPPSRDIPPDIQHQADTLRADATRIFTLPTRNDAGVERSNQAMALVLDTPDDVLQAMDLESKANLLESLVERGDFPAGGRESKDEPLRVALRKLYAAMPLDPNFLRTDVRIRERAVATLMQEHGAAFQFYRNNWALLDIPEREQAIRLALDAHCRAMGVPVPPLSLQGDGGNRIGSYQSTTGKMVLHTGEAFNDFDVVMNTLFHENTHYHQHLQAMQSRNGPVANPLQVRIFDLSIKATANYVSGEEDIAAYRHQPIEAHAWMAGDHAMALLTQALDRFDRGNT